MFDFLIKNYKFKLARKILAMNEYYEGKYNEFKQPYHKGCSDALKELLACMVLNNYETIEDTLKRVSQDEDKCC